MARFDLYRAEVGFIIDVQSNLLDVLATRLVAPLLPLQAAPVPASRLNPVLDVEGQLYSLHPQLMGAVPTHALGAPAGNAVRHYDRIVAAIDMVFLGF